MDKRNRGGQGLRFSLTLFDPTRELTDQILLPASRTRPWIAFACITLELDVKSATVPDSPVSQSVHTFWIRHSEHDRTRPKFSAIVSQK